MMTTRKKGDKPEYAQFEAQAERERVAQKGGVQKTKKAKRAEKIGKDSIAARLASAAGQGHAYVRWLGAE